MGAGRIPSGSEGRTPRARDPLARRVLFSDHGRVRAPWLIALPLVGAYVAMVAVEAAVYGRLALPWVQLLLSATSAVVAIALILVSRRLLHAPRGLAEYGLAVDRRWAVDLLAGLGIGVAGVSIPYLLGLWVGWVEVVTVFDAGALALWLGILVYGLAMLLTGLWEELLLRGVFVTNAADGLRRWLSPSRAVAGAIAVSALVFGLAHLAQPAHPSFIVTWVLSGVVLGVVYVLSGNLAVVIGAHAAFNITSNVLFARTDVVGLEDLSAIMRVEVDPSLGFLGAGGVLDAAAFVVVGLLALLWLRHSRGALSVDLDSLGIAGEPQGASPAPVSTPSPPEAVPSG